MWKEDIERESQRRQDADLATLAGATAQNLEANRDIAESYKQLVDIELRRDWREKQLFAVAFISLFGSIAALVLSWLSFWVAILSK